MRGKSTSLCKSLLFDRTREEFYKVLPRLHSTPGGFTPLLVRSLSTPPRGGPENKLCDIIFGRMAMDKKIYWCCWVLRLNVIFPPQGLFTRQGAKFMAGTKSKKQGCSSDYF